MNKQTEAKPTAEAAMKMAIEYLTNIQLDYKGHEVRKACKEALEQPALVCEVCGSTMTDEELAEKKKTNPQLISCCPDRKMVEQPAQEPVAYLWLEHGKPRNAFLHEPMQDNDDGYWTKKGFSYKPLYTHPAPSWQGLSDDEILKLYNECHIYDYKMGLCFARAIEQALKEKNCG